MNNYNSIETILSFDSMAESPYEGTLRKIYSGASYTIDSVIDNKTLVALSKIGFNSNLERTLGEDMHLEERFWRALTIGDCMYASQTMCEYLSTHLNTNCGVFLAKFQRCRYFAEHYMCIVRDQNNYWYAYSPANVSNLIYSENYPSSEDGLTIYRRLRDILFANTLEGLFRIIRDYEGKNATLKGWVDYRKEEN